MLVTWFSRVTFASTFTFLSHNIAVGIDVYPIIKYLVFILDFVDNSTTASDYFRVMTMVDSEVKRVTPLDAVLLLFVPFLFGKFKSIKIVLKIVLF